MVLPISHVGVRPVPTFSDLHPRHQACGPPWDAGIAFFAVKLDARRRAAVGAQIVEGYRRHPQTDADEEAALANLRELVAAESW